MRGDEAVRPRAGARAGGAGRPPLPAPTSANPDAGTPRRATPPRDRASSSPPALSRSPRGAALRPPSPLGRRAPHAGGQGSGCSRAFRGLIHDAGGRGGDRVPPPGQVRPGGGHGPEARPGGGSARAAASGATPWSWGRLTWVCTRPGRPRLMKTWMCV
nr:uncharacterized protein LOC116149879 [Camelus dromedarius]